jgi:hypothetical protein
MEPECNGGKFAVRLCLRLIKNAYERRRIASGENYRQRSKPFMSHEERKMIEDTTHQSQGVASLFEKRELKSFFKAYVYILFVLEILIFFISFLCQLEPIHIPFPWRYYLLASFLTPVVITFLLGVIIKSFNLFYFGLDKTAEAPPASDGTEKKEKSNSNKLDSSMRFFHQIPFLFTLLLLILGAIFVSQIDHIMAFVGVVGEKALMYGMTILGVLTFIATVVAIFWLVIRFKLEKLRYQYEYKRDVMLQLGVLVTEDDKLLDQKGRVFSLPNPALANSSAKQIVQAKIKEQ